VYTKRSGSRGGRGGVYGEPATVSDMPHQAPLRAISGYAPVCGWR